MWAVFQALILFFYVPSKKLLCLIWSMVKFNPHFNHWRANLGQKQPPKKCTFGKALNIFSTEKKGTLSPFNDHLHRRGETGGWGHLRSAVSVISVGNGADAGFIGVLFSSMPRSMVSVHTDNSIYSDVPWHNHSAKCMEQQNLSPSHPDESTLAAFVIQ